MRIALYQPDIPQNTGTILRLGACLGIGVDVIGPAGFDMSDRALRRAGLDYLHQVDLKSFVSFDAYLADRAQQQARGSAGRLVLLTTKASKLYYRFAFRHDDVLLLGRESAGVPDHVHQIADARLKIPLKPGMRSLNVAVAAAIVTGEALRQCDLFPPSNC